MSGALQRLVLQESEQTSLPSGWYWQRLEDVTILLKPGKLYDENSVSEEGKVPVVNQSANRFHGFHNEEPGVDASPERPIFTFANHTCAMRLMKRPYSSIQNIFSRVGKPGVADTTYLYYASLRRLTLSGYRGHHPIYRNQWIPVPALPVQTKIASILSAYDDLIDNNRRRVALLEEAARLLYRQWFVHFLFPGHEHVKIIDGLPEGWERRTIGDITAFLGRGISPSYDDEAEYLVVNQKCVRNRMLAMAPARRQKKEFKPEKALRCLDVLINSTGTGTLGRVAQCWFEPSNTTFDSHVTVARPIDAVDPYWFGYAMLELESVFEGMGDGATNQKELGRARIADTCLISPTHLLQRNFGSFASDTANQIQVLADQNDKLAQARDLLLPRLMNGEITV